MCNQYTYTNSNCRYCDSEVIVSKKRRIFANMCDDEECVKKAKMSCTKKLNCGHQCSGNKDESSCPPCLTKECL